MPLPVTGTAQLLEVLSPFVPDDLLNQSLPSHGGPGRRCEWSAAQLYRTLLLLLLTPARSSNLLCRLLPEQRAWRRFAHLPNVRHCPNGRQLHEFRARLAPALLRRINEHLLRPLLRNWPAERPGVGLIDATDLPAATNEYKKSPAASSPRTAPPWAGAPRSPGKAAGSSATKSTRCGSGCPSIAKVSCWCR